MKGLTVLLAALALAITAGPVFAHSSTGSNTYTVQSGDLSVWEISQRKGWDFGAILDLNWDNDMLDCIRIGDTFLIP